MLHDPGAEVQEFWVEEYDDVCELLSLLLFHDDGEYQKLRSGIRVQQICVMHD